MTGYLGGLARAIVVERAVGRIDGVLLFEAEKSRVESKMALPETDAEGTSLAPRDLRSVYRAECAKLLAKQSAHLGELVDPYNVHLEKLESDYTKAGKLTEAKAVRVYRTELAAELSDIVGTGAVASAGPTSAGSPDGTKAGEVKEFGGIAMVCCPPGLS